MKLIQPELFIYDCQSRQPVDLVRLQEAASAAYPLVLESPGGPGRVLPDLEELEISILDDEAIADVHARFLEDPTPTDVITFHHGEILISADTAARQAAEHSQPLQRELALYLIHGLLHLHGHDDHAPEAAQVMRQTQERILAQVWPESDAAQESGAPRSAH